MTPFNFPLLNSGESYKSWEVIRNFYYCASSKSILQVNSAFSMCYCNTFRKSNANFS